VREKRPDAVLIYDRLHEPRFNIANVGFIRNFLTEYYGYAPQITPGELMSLGYIQVMRMEQRGQWITVYLVRN